MAIVLIGGVFAFSLVCLFVIPYAALVCAVNLSALILDENLQAALFITWVLLITICRTPKPYHKAAICAFLWTCVVLTSEILRGNRNAAVLSLLGISAVSFLPMYFWKQTLAKPCNPWSHHRYIFPALG